MGVVPVVSWRHEIEEEKEEELYEPVEQRGDVPRDWEPSPETLRAIWGETDIISEEARLDATVHRLKQIEWLKPETWSHLDEYQRRVALDSAGRELASVYECPNPPLLAGPLQGEHMDSNLRGAYDGEDYYIEENFRAEMDHGELLGDDAAAALGTYAHEFRHAYQQHEASLYEGGQFFHLVDDPEKAVEWATNLRDYKTPDEDYNAYHNQPVESDARDFAEKLVRRVYGQL